ncbi:tRNA (adenosine(37)-N6)-dimethylallyltransferase MiaA [bacterium AH-315-F18]|nr:tRNA (adenosine(37)-N6)-dimethylallyltransferase MiaA [bacterium AH-315-F18]
MPDTSNALVVLGATAAGKTRLGVHLARAFGGEVLSADSRQVYRGLDIGAGKDLEEYTQNGTPIPYHLIDVVDLDVEFNVFDYQRLFFEVFEEVTARGELPVVVGGTGLYLEAVLKGYRMVKVPEDAALRSELEKLEDAALVDRLLALKPDQHNTTDLEHRHRLVRAIEIAQYSSDHAPEPVPDVRAVILGVRRDRAELRRRISARLEERMNHGLIEEVEGLHAGGMAWSRLEWLGLEYRFIARFLQGTIKTREELFKQLNIAIGQVAKRQETFFRRMERRGAEIHWIDEANLEEATRVAKKLLRR